MIKLTPTNFNLSNLSADYSISKIEVSSRKEEFSYECWELTQKELIQIEKYLSRSQLKVFIPTSQITYNFSKKIRLTNKN